MVRSSSASHPQRPHMRTRLGATAALLVLGLAPFIANAQAPLPGSSYDGEAFTFRPVTEDVYLAIGTGSLTVMSNAAVIVNEEDVLIVDSHVSPAAAQALLDELRRITDKPVRYVVNSHYHFDHAHGNQVYPGEIEIIGHEFTREMLASGASLVGRAPDRYLGPIPARIATLREQLAGASTAEDRALIQGRLQIQENFLAATQSVVPTPPTITMNDRMTMHRGGREIQLLFFGRGHTGGDIVVFLPEERVLFTGDLLLASIPFMGDAYLPEWIETLERLRELDFETILPGHGGPFTDRSRIDHLQAYMRDLWAQIVTLHRAGVPAEEAAARIDLREHRTHYPAAGAIGADIDAVSRAYELLDQGY